MRVWQRWNVVGYCSWRAYGFAARNRIISKPTHSRRADIGSALERAQRRALCAPRFPMTKRAPGSWSTCDLLFTSTVSFHCKCRLRREWRSKELSIAPYVGQSSTTWRLHKRACINFFHLQKLNIINLSNGCGNRDLSHCKEP